MVQGSDGTLASTLGHAREIPCSPLLSCRLCNITHHVHRTVLPLCSLSPSRELMNEYSLWPQGQRVTAPGELFQAQRHHLCAYTWRATIISVPFLHGLGEGAQHEIYQDAPR